MLNFRRFVVLLFLAALSQTTARADFQITVIPSIGPNAADYNFLPSVPGYYANALNALAATTSVPLGLTPGTGPGTAYAPSSTKVPIASITTTQFQSWMGLAPGAGAYSGQYGGSLYYGAVIQPKAGNTATFTLASLNASEVATDPNDLTGLGFSYSGFGPSAKIYVQTTAGGPWVASTTVTDSTPLYGLITVGSTDSFIGDYYNPSNTSSLVGATNQEILSYNLLSAGINTDFPVTENYNFVDSNGHTNSGGVSLDVQGVPEPASWTLLGVGAIGLMWRRRLARAKLAV